jgi:peptide/nickel transport system permease protein
VGAYVVRRVTLLFGMLIALSMIVFLLFAALPADPAALTCGKSCTPQIIAANRVRLGLDKPLVVQYANFVKGLFVGTTYGTGQAQFSCPAPSLGYSFRQGECVTDLLKSRIPVTISLAVGAFVLWMFFGILSGIIAALRRGRWQDRTLTGLALVGYSFPSFFIGLLLIFFVVIKWGILPYPQYVAPTTDFPGFLQAMILPWISVALLYAAFYTRLTRTQMLETLGEDYIRTARAKGLAERIVVRKHALRAGLTPIVTAAGLDLAGLLGGAIITEAVFNLPGLGRLAIDSVTESDLPVITATVLVAATFILFANLIVDLLYAVIDPRVRLT